MAGASVPTVVATAVTSASVSTVVPTAERSASAQKTPMGQGNRNIIERPTTVRKETAVGETAARDTGALGSSDTVTRAHAWCMRDCRMPDGGGAVSCHGSCTFTPLADGLLRKREADTWESPCRGVVHAPSPPSLTAY